MAAALNAEGSPEANAPKPPVDGLDSAGFVVDAAAPNAEGVADANALNPPAAGLDSAGFAVDPRADANEVGADANALNPPDVVVVAAGFCAWAAAFPNAPKALLPDGAPKLVFPNAGCPKPDWPKAGEAVDGMED